MFFWKWLKTQLFELRSGGHSTSWAQSRKRSVRVIWYLFGMAPQGVVHLQNASFWRAHKFELASLGILVQCQLWSCRQTSVPWIWCERLLVASVTWWREGVTWAFFGSLKTTLAAAFWISCRGLIVHVGRPAKITLKTIWNNVNGWRQHWLTTSELTIGLS